MERSVADKIRTQHQLLASSLTGALRAGQRRDQAELERRIQSLARVLETHLVLEEEHYFPEKKRELPDLAADIDDLALQHEDLRAAVAAVTEQCAAGNFEAAVRALQRYGEVFGAHEKLEWELLEGGGA